MQLYVINLSDLQQVGGFLRDGNNGLELNIDVQVLPPATACEINIALNHHNKT
jgi:hypothetical protein